MNSRQRRDETLGLILRAGLLPNLIKDSLDPFALAEEAGAVGIRCMEVSCRRDRPLELLGRLKERFPDMRFGASSLLEDGPYFDFVQRRRDGFPSIHDAVETGADFLVSMIAFSPRTYRRYPDMLLVPGVHSPQEAREQLDQGAGLIKVGLAGLYEPAYIKGTFYGAPIHSAVPLLLTGGLRPEKIDAYVDAGMLVGVCGFDAILAGDYEAQKQDFDPAVARAAMWAYVEAFQRARAKYQPDVDFASADALAIQEQAGCFMNVRS